MQTQQLVQVCQRHVPLHHPQAAAAVASTNTSANSAADGAIAPGISYDPEAATISSQAASVAAAAEHPTPWGLHASSGCQL